MFKLTVELNYIEVKFDERDESACFLEVLKIYFGSFDKNLFAESNSSNAISWAF